MSYNRQANIDALVEELRAKGYNDYAIAGMLGRAQRESSFNTSIGNPDDAGPGKDSMGLFQWNRDRLDRLKAFAAEQGTKWNDPRTQAKYTAWEITEGPESATNRRLRDANSLEAGVDAAMLYTRPQGSMTRRDGKWVATPRQGLHYKETTEAAADFYKMISGKDYVPDPANQVQGVDTASVDPAAPTTPTTTPEAKTPFGLKLPTQVAGVDTGNGLDFMKAMSGMMAQQTEATNAATPKGGLLGGSNPIAYKPNPNSAAPVAAGGLLSGGTMPIANKKAVAISTNQAEELERLRRLLGGGLGGLGGLGGFA